MSKKQWLALLLLFIAYLALGAAIFYVIEKEAENEKIDKDNNERRTIYNLLSAHYVPSIKYDDQILKLLTDYCGKSVYNRTEEEIVRRQWNFYNSFYFAYTVVSTIGYGNLAPTTTLSRILMIIYGLIGIPMNGILLTQLGEFFSRVFIRSYQKYKSYKHRQSCDCPSKKPISSETRMMRLAAQIFLYLTPGFIVFIFFPAILFSYYEQWAYDESVYYAFVTLTTIGFGDLVAGQDDTKGSGPFFILYKIFLICWISFGLGYIVMIMTFIARGMRSKKITWLEHKLAMNLKHTQSKIWNEFNKEVNYLRRVFNELQLSKVKRVYVDEYECEEPPAKFPRSNSFPNLRDLTIGGYVDSFIPHPRRRANSEVAPTIELTRVVSETDLQRIDKNATFAAHAIVQPAELLARLVNVLGYIPPRDDLEWAQTEERADAQNETQQSKSTDQGLGGNAPRWTIGGEKLPFAKPRSRAASEIRLHVTRDDSNQHNEWTWSGVASTKLQELMKDRDATVSSKDSASKPYRKFTSLALPITAPKNFFPRWRKQFASKRSSDVGPNTRNMEKTVETMDDSEKSNLENNSIGPLPSYLNERYDSISKKPHYYTHTGGNLPTYLEGNNLLEETSLADFLRALTALHARVGTVPDECVGKPKRKLGTACLSPPKLPSLFTLFSNAPGSVSATQSNQTTVTGAQSSRRMSLRLTDNSGSSTPTSYIRKGSVAVKPRRFSLRPVPTPMSPPTPPDYGSPRLPLRPSQRIDNRNLQEHVSMEPFISMSPKEPLVNMEGPPGISSPIQQPFGKRRFSIRPAQLGTQPSPTSTKSTPTPLHTPKPLPKWKAGMLQRQITQMNLRRRTRALSLGDVHSDRREKAAAPLSPLAMDNTRTVDVTKPGNPNQKTVTIISPAEEMSVTRNELQGAAVIPTGPRDEEAAPWGNREDVTSSTNPFESTISNVHGDERRSQRDSVPVYEPVYKSPSSTAFEQKLMRFNDGLGRTLQRGMQETNVDFGETPLKMEEKRDDTHVCVIDNLGELQEAKSSTGNGSRSAESRKGKPSVSIDSYKPQLQMTIEKPTVNPFEQYRAMTKAARKEDAELKEVKVEKPGEK